MKPVANRLSSMCAVSEDTCTGPAEDEQVSPETRLFAASCIAMARASQNESLVVGYDDGSALATYTVELDRHAGLQRFRSALERVVARGVPDAMVRCVDITGRDPSGIHDLVFRLQDHPWPMPTAQSCASAAAAVAMTPASMRGCARPSCRRSRCSMRRWTQHLPTSS